MEAKDLIYLVSCAVNGVTPDAERVADMDLDAIFSLASRHMLAATVAPALKAAGIQDKRFAKALEHSALKNSTMDMEMDAVFAALTEAGIWHMPLKGIVLQHLYPIYGMRQMSDHDILFDAKRADDVKSIMEGLGFRTAEFGGVEHDVYRKEPVSNFEMHRELFDYGQEVKLYEYYRDVEKRLLGDGCEKHFSPEDFYIFMIAHEYKHYMLKGTGLRSVADTYVYLQKTALDMGYVTAEAGKLGIETFEAVNRSLALHLFSGEALTETDEEMLDFILASGVYGTYDAAVPQSLSDSGTGKIRYIYERFMGPVKKGTISYRTYSQKYPFFYKHKVLLPFLQLHLVFIHFRCGLLAAELKALRNAKR